MCIRDRIISLVYALLWLVTGWSVGLRGWLEGFLPNEWLLIATFAMIFAGSYTFITLPLDYYAGFTLPHRFELSTQNRKGWIADQLKTLVVSAIFGLLLIELVYWPVSYTHLDVYKRQVRKSSIVDPILMICRSCSIAMVTEVTISARCV